MTRGTGRLQQNTSKSKSVPTASLLKTNQTKKMQFPLTHDLFMSGSPPLTQWHLIKEDQKQSSGLLQNKGKPFRGTRTGSLDSDHTSYGWLCYC